MSVRITNDKHTVALYDSVTGIAFGPVFDDAADAEEFLLFSGALGDADLRTLTPADLIVRVQMWEATRNA